MTTTTINNNNNIIIIQPVEHCNPAINKCGPRLRKNEYDILENKIKNV